MKRDIPANDIGKSTTSHLRHEEERDKPEILIVNGDMEMTSYLKQLLENDFIISIAVNFREAFQKIKLRLPQLIISNSMMPDMNGLDFVKTIKANTTTDKIPLLLLSTRSGEDAIKDGYENGVDDYLITPFSARELLARVNGQLKIANSWKSSEANLKNIFRQAPFALTILKGEDLQIEFANDKALELWDRTLDQVLNKKIFESFPELAQQGFKKILDTVYKTGEAFRSEGNPIELFRKGKLEQTYINFVYEPLRDEEGIVRGIMGVGIEVTEEVRARQRVEESYEQMRHLLMQAPAAIAILKGPTLIYENANLLYQKVVGKSDLIGKPGREAIPEIIEQGIWDDFDRVYTTGEPYVASELPIDLDRIGNGQLDRGYFNFVMQPLKDISGKVERILVHAVEVTEQVKARRKTEESETRLKLAIEAAQLGTFEWDLQTGNFVYSPRFAEIFGMADALHKSQNDFNERIHPEDRSTRDKAYEKAKADGALFYEARIILPDKLQRWIKVNGKIIYNEDNVPVRMYGTVLDISEQKSIEGQLEKKVEERTLSLIKLNEELRLSEERYHKMTEEVQDYAIILLDDKGKILNWNKGAQNIKGYSESEILGKNFHLFYLLEDKTNGLPDRLLMKARMKGRAMHEGWRIRKDGSKFWGSVVLTALHDDDNNVIGFTKVTRDLTERKLNEDKVKQYTVELEFQNKELEQFAYIASHDLQEPLRKIQTFSEILQNNLHNADLSKKYFEKINSSANRMSLLIKSVLNYSKLSKTDELFEDVDLNLTLENVKIDFELLISEKDAEIVANTLPVIKGLPLQLNQLFSNLIGNALKFTDKKPRIEITSKILSNSEVVQHEDLQPAQSYIELKFQDNGIGFDQQYANQIFAIFQRLHSKQSYSGTGIGLALCKRIVENHHGLIVAQSEPGKGATFFITLPIL